MVLRKKDFLLLSPHGRSLFAALDEMMQGGAQFA